MSNPSCDFSSVFALFLAVNLLYYTLFDVINDFLYLCYVGIVYLLDSNIDPK